MTPESRLADAVRASIVRARTLSIDLRLEGADSFHTDVRAHRADPGSAFGPWHQTPDPYDAVVIRQHQAAERTRMLVAMGAAAARPGARITVVGHNDAGGRSAGKFLAERVGQPFVVATKFHCRAWSADLVEPVPSSLPEWRSAYELPDLVVVSYPGVFSHGRLDDGTRMLLSVLPRSARALDVGCGSGVVAAWLAARGAAVDAIDVDALALQATRETAPGATVFASDVFDAIGERYELIVSNPPFHAGKKRTAEAAVRLIEGAPDALTPRGELWLVANRFLPYARVLEATFGSFEVAAEDRSFRVYRARLQP